VSSDVINKRYFFLENRLDTNDAGNQAIQPTFGSNFITAEATIHSQRLTPLRHGSKTVRVLAKYKGVSESFRTGCLERELQIVQLSAIKYSCNAML
jgi:hypothetical protein